MGSMEILSTIITVVFVIICLLLILVILMQSNRSSGMGLFGGGGSQSAFGSSSADVLTKATGGMAIMFMVLAMTLAIMKSQKSSLSDVKKEIEKPAIQNSATPENKTENIDAKTTLPAENTIPTAKPEAVKTK